MTREEVFERLNEVFRDVFDDEMIKVKDTTTADDIEDWDSLEHINLVVAVSRKNVLMVSCWHSADRLRCL